MKNETQVSDTDTIKQDDPNVNEKISNTTEKIMEFIISTADSSYTLEDQVPFHLKTLTNRKADQDAMKELSEGLDPKTICAPPDVPIIRDRLMVPEDLDNFKKLLEKKEPDLNDQDYFDQLSDFKAAADFTSISEIAAKPTRKSRSEDFIVPTAKEKKEVIVDKKRLSTMIKSLYPDIIISKIENIIDLVLLFEKEELRYKDLICDICDSTKIDFTRSTPEEPLCKFCVDAKESTHRTAKLLAKSNTTQSLRLEDVLGY